jgi:hypothetical protein
VERGVEHGHVRDVREPAARFFQRCECGPVVERRKLRERFELGANGVVDDHGLAKALPAVDDPVSDRLYSGRCVAERRDLG